MTHVITISVDTATSVETRGTELSELVWTPPSILNSRTEPQPDRSQTAADDDHDDDDVKGKMADNLERLFLRTLSDF